MTIPLLKGPIVYNNKSLAGSLLFINDVIFNMDFNINSGAIIANIYNGSPDITNINYSVHNNENYTISTFSSGTEPWAGSLIALGSFITGSSIIKDSETLIKAYSGSILAYYPFYQNTNDVVNGLNGSASGLLFSTNKNGRFSAAFFNGSNTSVVTPLYSGSTIGGTGSLVTMGLIVKPYNKNGMILSGSTFSLRVGDEYILSLSGSETKFAAVDYNVWSRIILTIGSTSTNIYFNGSLSHTITSGSLAGTNAFVLGKNATTDEYFYSGAIDTFIVFNKEFSQNECIAFDTNLRNELYEKSESYVLKSDEAASLTGFWNLGSLAYNKIYASIFAVNNPTGSVVINLKNNAGSYITGSWEDNIMCYPQVFNILNTDKFTSGDSLVYEKRRNYDYHLKIGSVASNSSGTIGGLILDTGSLNFKRWEQPDNTLGSGYLCFDAYISDVNEIVPDILEFTGSLNNDRGFIIDNLAGSFVNGWNTICYPLSSISTYYTLGSINYEGICRIELYGNVTDYPLTPGVFFILSDLRVVDDAVFLSGSWNEKKPYSRQYFVEMDAQETGSFNSGSILELSVASGSQTGSIVLDSVYFGEQNFNQQSYLVKDSSLTGSFGFTQFIDKGGSVVTIGSTTTLLKTTLLFERGMRIYYNYTSDDDSYLLDIGSSATLYEIKQAGSLFNGSGLAFPIGLGGEDTQTLGSTQIFETNKYYNILIQKDDRHHEVWIQDAELLGSGYHISGSNNTLSGSEIKIVASDGYVGLRNLFILNDAPTRVFFSRVLKDTETVGSPYGFIDTVRDVTRYNLTYEFEFTTGGSGTGPILAGSSNIAYGPLFFNTGSSLFVKHELNTGSYSILGSFANLGSSINLVISKDSGVFKFYDTEEVTGSLVYVTEKILQTGSYGFIFSNDSTLNNYQYVPKSQLGIVKQLDKKSTETYLFINGNGGAELHNLYVKYSIGSIA